MDLQLTAKTALVTGASRGSACHRAPDPQRRRRLDMAPTLTQEQRMPLIRSMSLPHLARLTVAWGAPFAIVHFYWAAGGTALNNAG